MKRILQAMDSVATKPVAGANDMTKFLSIIDKNDVKILTEAKSPHKVTLPVQMAMQHYQTVEEPVHKPVGRDSVIRKYFKEVEEELTAEKTEKRQLINQYASIISERVLMKKSLDEACWDKYKQVGMKKKGRKMVPNCVPKESVAENADQVKKVFKDKSGKPVGEIGIDPESSPGNGEWYVHHYATGYSVVGFDSAAEAKRELMYVHKHPDAVEGHPSTKEQGIAEATPRHFGPKGAGTELARQIRANGELDRNKQPEPTGIPKKNEFTITEPKAKIQVKKNKGVAENEIPGHSMGFTGGVGPGLQSNVAEAPIELDRDNPMASTIHSHQGANPGSIEYRIMRARRQLRDLAEQAESDSPLVWQHIARLFPELAMNIEQINHGLGELKNIRSKGGKNSRNIPALEAVMPPIKAAKPTAPKTVKPKAKTSACKAGQVQTGMQIKDGKSVPKCSVTKK